MRLDSSDPADASGAKAWATRLHLPPRRHDRRQIAPPPVLTVCYY